MVGRVFIVNYKIYGCKTAVMGRKVVVIRHEWGQSQR